MLVCFSDCHEVCLYIHAKLWALCLLTGCWKFLWQQQQTLDRLNELSFTKCQLSSSCDLKVDQVECGIFVTVLGDAYTTVIVPVQMWSPVRFVCYRKSANSRPLSWPISDMRTLINVMPQLHVLQRIVSTLTSTLCVDWNERCFPFHTLALSAAAAETAREWVQVDAGADATSKDSTTSTAVRSLLNGN